MIRAGKLDREITIERRHDIINTAGTVTPVWTAHATVRAGIIEPRINELTGEDGTSETETLTMIMRHLAVTTSDRVRMDDQLLDITGLQELGRRRGLRMTCKAAS